MSDQASNFNSNSGVGVLDIDLTGQDVRIGIVQARFNEAHCVALSNACIKELIALGVAQEDIRLVTVPGALEIPFALQKLAQTGEFDGLVALGAVIRGETYHFELVSNESAAGITRVSLDAGLPIANGVLTIPNLRHIKLINLNTDQITRSINNSGYQRMAVT